MGRRRLRLLQALAVKPIKSRNNLIFPLFRTLR
jgi:hypothetical protein